MVACSLMAVVWQVGAVSALGLALDPFSVLTPFLVFALGVSHGAQKMNGIMQDVGRGTHRLVAARYTFRRLFLAGLTALANDAVGFAALLLVDVSAVRQLAVTAMAGSAALVFTNLILLPVLLSFAGVNPAAAARSLRDGSNAAVWGVLERLTRPRWAAGVLAVAAAATLVAALAGPRLEVGDLEPGAPELAPGVEVQPGRRLPRRPLRPQRGSLRRHRPDRRRRAASTTRRWSRPIASPGRCGSCRGCGRPPRCRRRCGRSRPAPSRATRAG